MEQPEDVHHLNANCPDSHGEWASENDERFAFFHSAVQFYYVRFVKLHFEKANSIYDRTHSTNKKPVKRNKCDDLDYLAGRWC